MGRCLLKRRRERRSRRDRNHTKPRHLRTRNRRLDFLDACSDVQRRPPHSLPHPHHSPLCRRMHTVTRLRNHTVQQSRSPPPRPPSRVRRVCRVRRAMQRRVETYRRGDGLRPPLPWPCRRCWAHSTSLVLLTRPRHDTKTPTALLRTMYRLPLHPPPPPHPLWAERHKTYNLNLGRTRWSWTTTSPPSSLSPSPVVALSRSTVAAVEPPAPST
mmetsp:Transcript_26372/g.62695  ORF Transcript_26372/g.62695 Transcript_26372/m.62695 type:complete len:214 (+) Transcript_26372:110-751(+)